MARKASNLSRRDVLRTTSGSLVGLAASGLAGASADLREVNVGFAAASGREAALAAAESVTRTFDSIPVVTIRLPRSAIDALANRPDVRYVEENGTMEALGQSLPWGIDRIDAEIAYGNGKTGGWADIAIIDTGIDSDHPDLQANLGAGKAFVQCDEACSSIYCNGNDNACHETWDDDNDHGTHVAGIVGASNDSQGVVGVAPEATLHAVKVLDCCGSGTYSDIAAGIEWVADQGWDVGSMSLGGSASSVLKDACTYAESNGVLLVAAAGNDGPCTDCVSYPAAYSEVVAVSATTMDDTLSPYSSTGPDIELAAPGGDPSGTDREQVISTIPGGYDSYTGTSVAAPHVAGAGGLLMSDGYSNTQARNHLQATAENVGLPPDEQGAGLVDVADAFGMLSIDDLNGPTCTGVDASAWPRGTGASGAEHITQVDLRNQVVKTSADHGYYDFACNDVVTVSQGGSFIIELAYDNAGYDGHYANVYVDWDQNGDWSTATETQIMEDVDDDSVTYSTRVFVPTSAPKGRTLARVRLSWGSFDGPTVTDEFGEVDDFAIEVR